MFDINRNPSQRDLRWFAALWFPIAGSALGWAMWRCGAAASQIGAAVGLGLTLAVAGVWAPSLTRPVYLAWSLFTWPLGWLFSVLLLICVYYLVLTPLGIVGQLCRGDFLKRRADSSGASYWTARRQRRKEDYFRQF